MYAELLETLHGLKRHTHYYIEHYHSDPADNKKQAEMSRIWSDCSAKLERLEDLASFRLSNRAVRILEDYRKEEAAAVQKNTYDWAQGPLDAIKRCLVELKQEARSRTATQFTNSIPRETPLFSQTRQRLPQG